MAGFSFPPRLSWGFWWKPPKFRPRLRSLPPPQRQSGYGPGQPPAGFIGGTNSVTEWMVYWALTKLLGPEGLFWTYQESFLGGRYVPGGSVADFVVYLPNATIVIRVQTFYFHTGADSIKQQYDFRQKFGIMGAYAGEVVVIDLWEQDFVNDKTGAAVLRVVQDALMGVEHPNPIASGLVFDA